MGKSGELSGKVALITGSSSGMGKAIAEALGSNGASVIVSSNDAEGCEKTAKNFSENGIEAFPVVCDVSDRDQLDSLYDQTLMRFGVVDILVNTVGMAIYGGFMDIDDETFEKTMQINLKSAIYLTQKVIPSMQKKKDGVLIYLASLSSFRGNKNIGLYGISKAALVQLARNLAVEFGPDNIRSNAISPGVINTEFAQPIISDAELLKRRIALTPLRRIGSVNEVAGMAVLLASQSGAFITGQNIIIDGGTCISDGN